MQRTRANRGGPPAHSVVDAAREILHGATSEASWRPSAGTGARLRGRGGARWSGTVTEAVAVGAATRMRVEGRVEEEVRT